MTHLSIMTSKPSFWTLSRISECALRAVAYPIAPPPVCPDDCVFATPGDRHGGSLAGRYDKKRSTPTSLLKPTLLANPPTCVVAEVSHSRIKLWPSRCQTG
jgi:hypothetical protein